MAKKTTKKVKRASGNDFRNGYSAGYKGYPLSAGRSTEYKAGHAKGRILGGKRKKRLP